MKIKVKIKKGDKVKVIKGKDRSKDGTVERVFPKSGKVLIVGVNLFKKHVKPKADGQKGEIVSVPRPLPIANVAVICPKCKKPTRIGIVREGKKSHRICRKCQSQI